jgi:GNAT superfamily N-acetyltransferase
MNIRRATIFDISALAMMLVDMHNQTELNTPKISSEKLINKISEAVHRGVVFVATTDENGIIGSIGGHVGSDWWSEEKFLADNWFYVHPENRKSRAGYLLIKEFMNVAKEAKIPLRLGHIFSGDLERKDKFYTKLGLIKAGIVYVES